MQTLDIGCGEEPRGTVNCDLFLKDTELHRRPGKTQSNGILDKRFIPNFVICDAQFLPFQSDCFDSVFSAQVIEHVNNPSLMFREMVRVSKRLVTVETMHRLGEAFSAQKSRGSKKWFKKHHINKFNVQSLNEYATKNGCRVFDNYVLNYFCFPHTYFILFRVPAEIGMRCLKNA